MTTLYTLALPNLDERARSWIDRKRAQNDPDFQRIGPHFTLLFGCTDVPIETYIRHVSDIAKEGAPFEFIARRAVPGVDYFGTGGYVFLVPDEGHSNFLALHDRLYTGPLASKLNLGLPYIPHITLGRCSSLQEAKTLCDEWNSEAVSISGFIDAIIVAEEKDDAVTKLEELRL